MEWIQGMRDRIKAENKQRQLRQPVYTDLEISPLQEIRDLVNTIPNDQKLGEAIRNYINKYHE